MAALNIPNPPRRPSSPNLSPPSGAFSGQGTIYPRWNGTDLRHSSTQSLTPSGADDIGFDGGRRTLLMIYIHGFMGNDSSFRSFPAHVHNYLKEALVETHAIHSKIYPRYKTYKAIDVARDNFSTWLEPHESDTTDVVLVGHSMGGLLAADIVLIPNDRPGDAYPFKHRILGTISLDAPLLGLHPGIIMSGIASLFRPAPGPPKDDDPSASHAPSETALSPSMSPEPSVYSSLAPLSGATSPASPGVGTSMSSLSLSSASDPNFNPPFWNDVSFKDRGFLKNVAHFAKKHSQKNIFSAAADHIMNHLEFGSCLTDYPGMNARYEKIRRLEDVDDLNRSGHGKPGAVRVRFVNYYTLSTGRPKTPKAQSPHLKPEQAEARRSSHESSRASTPRISIEDSSDVDRPVVLQEMDPQPEPDSPAGAEDGPDHDIPPAYSELATRDGSVQVDAVSHAETAESENNAGQAQTELAYSLSLPAIQPLPPAPQAPSLDNLSDPEARKQAEKEAKRAQKAYDQAVKDRDKALKERQKLIEKHRRKLAKEAEKKEKEERKRREKEEAVLKKEAEKLQQTVANPAAAAPAVETDGQDGGGEKKKKDRKFIMLPKKVKEGKDDTWIMVYMQGVDEVGAHCGLFIPGPHYERLIGDVGSRVVGWVQEDATRRAIEGLGG